MATYAPMLTDNGSRMVMMKATGDPNTDGNWANVDGHVRFSRDNAGVTSLWAYEDSSDIHIATQAGQGSVSYHVFDPGTDTWTTKNEFVVTNDAGTLDVEAIRPDACSIALRSDGDVIIVYAGDIAGKAAILYARKESGTWTTETRVDGDGGGDHAGCVVVLGASDRMHFFYKNHRDHDLFHRSLSSANSLDTADQLVDSTLTTNVHTLAHGVSYVSTETKVRVPYHDLNLRVAIAQLDSGADPTLSRAFGASDDDVVGVEPGSPVACLAVDGTTVHLLYSNADQGSDIYHDENDDDAGWGTDTEEKDAVTCNRISCNVYTKSGTKVLAYLYLDGTTSKYAERILDSITELGIQPPMWNPIVRHMLVR